MTTRRRKASQFTPLLMCGLFAAGFAGAARAQAVGNAQGLLDDKFVLSLGAFILNTDVTARLDGASATNPDIDFDKTFGKGNDATRVRADALWRITPAHHLRLMYFDNSVNRSRVLNESVAWGDYTFQVGANVDAKFDYKVGALSYEYAFMRSPTYEIAASAGVHYTDITLKLSGAASITDANGNVTQSPFATKTDSTPVPLPVIGIRGGWVVSPDIYLEASGQFFKAKVGDYDGRIGELRASATWMFSRNFGVGLGYDRFTTTVDIDKPSFDGRVRWGYSGVQLFLTGSF